MIKTIWKNKKLLTIACCIGLSLLSACSSSEDTNQKRKVVNLDIDISKSTSRLASEVLDTVIYIPLETNSKSLFSDVTQLELFEKYIIIYDKTTDAIYFFLNDGKFSHKISNTGLTPEQSFTAISGFTLNRQERTITIRDVMRAKFVTYELTGKKISEINFPFDFQELGVSKGKYLIYRGYNNTISESILEKHNLKFKNILASTLSGEVNNSYLPYDPKLDRFDLYNTDKVFYNSGEQTLFCEPYTYNIYSVQGQNLDLNFKIELSGNRMIPDDFLTNDEYSKKRMSYFISNNKKIWSCEDVYTQNNRFILINLKSIRDLQNPVIYDLKTGKYMNLERIISEEKFATLLPIYGEHINGADGEYFYSAIDSQFMLQAAFLTASTSKLLKHPTLSTYFKGASNLSNPVISKIKFKHLN